MVFSLGFLNKQINVSQKVSKNLGQLDVYQRFFQQNCVKGQKFSSVVVWQLLHPS